MYENKKDKNKNPNKSKKFNINIKGLDIDKAEYQQIVLSDSAFPGRGLK